MPSLKLSYLVPLIAAALITFLYQQYLQTPIMAEQQDKSPAKSPSKPWADQPLKMVATPMFETGKDNTFTKGASHMALIHNAILRGYNSIYLQAPHVKPQDYEDFIAYCLTWFQLVKSHHDDEEENLFPKILDVLGKKDDEVWGATHGEHEAMLPGLSEFNSYLTSLPTPSSFSSPTLLSIMSTFQTPFFTHFHSEIATIASLSRYGDFPEAGPIFKTWGKSTITKAGYGDALPFLFFNFDRGFEGGLWRDWPPMPKVVRGALLKFGVWWGGRRGRWRFASCDMDGVPRELYASGK